MLRFLAICLLASSAFAGTEFNQWQGRIVGGNEARIGQFPYQVSVRSVLVGHFCGGSIFSENWVICAAHCTEGRSTITTRVVVAAHRLTGDGITHNVNRIVNHPRWNSRTITYDISVIRTSTPMLRSNLVQPIPLVTGPVNGGLDAVVSGWGQTRHPGIFPAQTLQFVSKSTLTNENCRAALLAAGNTAAANNIQDSTLCAGGVVGRGACMGDSGGPLTANGQLIGVVSWGVPCARGSPDMYARVDTLSSWIVDTAVN